MNTLSIPEKEVRPKRRFVPPNLKYVSKYFGITKLDIFLVFRSAESVYTSGFNFFEMVHTSFFPSIRKQHISP